MVSRNFIKKEKELGFTLIEMLVAIAIIGILSMVILTNVGARNTDLTRATQKLALDIRRAQNLSLAPTDNPNCLYGIRLLSVSSYALYRRQTCGLGAAGHRYDSEITSGGTSETLETVLLDGALIASPASWDVSFEPPEPVVYLDGSTGAPPTIIQLQVVGGTSLKEVEVNRFGRVEVR